MPLPDLTPEEIADLHRLPDDAFVTHREATAFLRLKPNTLAWHRSMGSGPPFSRMGGKHVRYRVGDLREYLKPKGHINEGVRCRADAMLAARAAKGQVPHG